MYNNVTVVYAVSFRQQDGCHGNDSPGDSPDDDDHLVEDYVHDSDRLETCIAHLRCIIGDGPSLDQLTRVTLAADFDVNRALNFYFS